MDESNMMEQARYQVEKKDIVVNGARIVCSYAANGSEPNFLIVPECHGIMQNKSNCAHDAHCVPWNNIYPFTSCISPFLEKTILALLQQGAAQEKKGQYKNILQTLSNNNQNYAKQPVPCILALLDRWFDADEKDTVSDVVNFGWEMRQELSDLLKKIIDILSGASRQNHSKYLSIMPKTKKFQENAMRQDKAIKEIKEIEREIILYFYTSFETEDKKFSGIVEKLNGVKNSLELVTGHMDDEKIISNVNDSELLKEELKDSIEEIDVMIKRINDWEEKEYHLITTSSFLICKCGGIITFSNSGQIYKESVDKVIASLLTMVTELKDHCKTGMEQYSDKDYDMVDNKWSSYQAAAQGLECFEQMLLGSTDVDNTGNVCIYLELICHSYNDELTKSLMSMLALISLQCNALAFVLSSMTLYDYIENTENAPNGTDAGSAGITFLETLNNDGTGGLVTQMGGKNIVNCNNLYTIIGCMVGFAYISYETWIETIKITVFTESHAHVSERFLEKTGVLKTGKNIQMYQKNEYTSINAGRGLEWKEEPGAYLRRLEHKGDNRNVKEGLINISEKVAEGVGYYE